MLDRGIVLTVWVENSHNHARAPSKEQYEDSFPIKSQFHNTFQRQKLIKITYQELLKRLEHFTKY